MGKYVVVSTKVGWIVQNSRTFFIAAGPYKLKEQAQAVCDNLNLPTSTTGVK